MTPLPWELYRRNVTVEMAKVSRTSHLFFFAMNSRDRNLAPEPYSLYETVGWHYLWTELLLPIADHREQLPQPRRCALGRSLPSLSQVASAAWLCDTQARCGSSAAARSRSEPSTGASWDLGELAAVAKAFPARSHYCSDKLGGTVWDPAKQISVPGAESTIAGRKEHSCEVLALGASTVYPRSALCANCAECTAGRAAAVRSEDPWLHLVRQLQWSVFRADAACALSGQPWLPSSQPVPDQHLLVSSFPVPRPNCFDHRRVSPLGWWRAVDCGQSAFSGAAGAMLSNGLTTVCRRKPREGSTLQSPVFGATERSNLGVQFLEPNM